MRRLLLLLFAALTVAAQAQPARRAITARDLFAFHWIGDTQLSPSGKTLCFVETTVTPDHSGYQSSLYLLDLSVPGATPQLLTLGNHDTSPRWSPDGTRIAFLRTATGSQLFLTEATPNAPVLKLTELPKGVSNPQWAPSGLALTVLSATPQDQPGSKLAAARLAHSTGDEAHVSDVRIINRAIYRSNGEGNLDPTLVPQLYLIALPKPDGTEDPAWQLTAGRFGVEESVWSSTGTVFYTESPTDEPIFDEFRHNTLYSITPTLEQGHPTAPLAPQLTYDLHLEAQGLALSADGRHLAFHAAAPTVHAQSHKQSDLWTLDLSPAAVTAPPRNLTAFQGYEMGSGVGGDNTAPRGGARPAILWSADSTHLLDVAGSRGSALLLSVDASSGEATQLSARLQSVLAFAATPDQSSVIALISNPILIGDLFRLDPAVQPGGPMSGSQPTSGGNQTQLTHSNGTLFAQLDLRMPERLKVTPTAHPNDIPYVTIDTFVQLPPDFPIENPDGTVKPTHPYPLILNIHGGPHSAYGFVFDHEMLLMAARGYIVDYPNPRGSTTYGENFANIIQNNYPGDDFHDLMDTVDDIVAKGWADPARLGVTGGSGGGLLTDWTVTQTERFKAAVAQRDITDWSNWWYTADITGFHQSFWPKSPPFDNVELFRAHSPLTFVNKVRTPMMFILGDADLRTPPTAGGEDFFRALKYKHIPTVMVRFPRESHELSRSGEPWHRIERLENILGWFDRYLLGKCEPQYDLQPTTCKP